VACWDDDWRPQWRVDLIPTYKSHRVAEAQPVGAVRPIEEVPAALSPQVAVIREVLGALGIPVIGAPRHEADDVIGTLASRSLIPVDIVTGDRDLFQVVDDSRDVRVIYTGRGMSRLEILTDATLETKYGVSPVQYADFAALRGDASDGLPGVPGVGDKSAAALLRTHGSLDGIIAAPNDPSSGMSSAVHARILGAADYPSVAPTVVRVVRDLELPEFDARIRQRDSQGNAELDRLSEVWGLGSSMTRAREALGSVVRARA
jgi:5'-3' exonuclease